MHPAEIIDILRSIKIESMFMGFRPAIVIPARYGSTRLPAKALKKIGSKTLIQHVWERALEADIAKVYVATDHSLIQEVVEDFGGTVIRTSEGCLTGSDRVAESLRHLPEEADSVINIQGDLPFIETSRLKEVLKPLCAGFDVATMLAPMPADRQSDPSTVKAIVSPAESTLIEDEELYRCHWFCRTALPYGMFHFGGATIQSDYSPGMLTALFLFLPLYLFLHL